MITDWRDDPVITAISVGGVALMAGIILISILFGCARRYKTPDATKAAPVSTADPGYPWYVTAAGAQPDPSDEEIIRGNEANIVLILQKVVTMSDTLAAVEAAIAKLTADNAALKTQLSTIEAQLAAANAALALATAGGPPAGSIVLSQADADALIAAAQAADANVAAADAITAPPVATTTATGT